MQDWYDIHNAGLSGVDIGAIFPGCLVCIYSVLFFLYIPSTHKKITLSCCFQSSQCLLEFSHAQLLSIYLRRTYGWMLFALPTVRKWSTVQKVNRKCDPVEGLHPLAKWLRDQPGCQILVLIYADPKLNICHHLLIRSCRPVTFMKRKQQCSDHFHAEN